MALAIASASISPSAQDVTTAPERLVTVDPRIPTAAAWIRGVVVVRFDVRLDGTTANVEIVEVATLARAPLPQRFDGHRE